MIYPERINKSGMIGVTATSAGLEDERDLHKLEKAILNFSEIGLKVIETPNVRTCQGLVSSSAQTRAEEFMNLWENENVKYIILARGGEFLMEMLPYLNLERLRKVTPKWVQGFSDSSRLLLYLTTTLNIATIHAANFSTYGMHTWHPSLLSSVQVVETLPKEFVQDSFELYEIDKISREEGKELEPYNLTEKVIYQNLYANSKEHMEGRLIGGCADVLGNLVGTLFDHVKSFCHQFPEGMIWYLENCEMSILDFYRSLWQMKMAGWFENAKGFLIGRTASKQSVGELSYEEILHKVFDDMNTCVVYDVDFGHLAPQWTMVNGASVKFDYEEGKGRLTTTFD